MQIKKAYRALALRYHPDLQTGNEERFREIVEAYEVLTGARKARRQNPQYSEEQLAKIYELIQKAAKEKARQKAFERAERIRRKKQEEQSKAYTKALNSLGVIIFLSLISFPAYKSWINFQINRSPAQGIAEVVGIEQNRVVYQFEGPDGVFQDRAYVRGVGLQMLADNGLPLKVGDSFVVRFNAQDPDWHLIDFQKISSQTFNRYLELASRAIYRSGINPLKGGGSIYELSEARCLALLLYNDLGLSAWAKCYFFDTNPLRNWKHNSLRWYFFSKTEAFQQRKADCNLPQ